MPIREMAARLAAGADDAPPVPEGMAQDENEGSVDTAALAEGLSGGFLYGALDSQNSQGGEWVVDAAGDEYIVTLLETDDGSGFEIRALAEDGQEHTFGVDVSVILTPKG